ncbi:MAG: mucoidy inhibitor MuiA family protein [Beijerinckiaceae bacterium]
MLRLIAAALLAGVSPLIAAEIPAASRIDGVVIYPGLATVTRVIEMDVPAGQHILVVSGLPQALDPASLRIEGQATGELQIGSVELRTQPLQGVQEPAGEVAQRLRTLQNERLKKQADINAITAKQAMIIAIGQQAPAILGGKEKPVDPADWAKAWNSVGAGLRGVAEELVAAQGALRTIDEEVAAISRQGAPGLRAGVTRAANVSVEAGAGGAKVRLLLSYQVSGATWRPAYDAALATNGKGVEPRLSLIRRAIVSQRTGEDWSDVTLSVSTAQARGGAQAPELPPVRVAFNEPPVVMQMAPAVAPAPGMARSGRVQGAFDSAKSAEAAAAPPPAPVAQQQATLEASAFAAQYTLPGRVSVSADGSMRTLRLNARELTPALQVKTVPGLDPKAYLEARFAHEEDAPLLAGEVSLTRDGVFVGQSRVAQTAPGDNVELGFGVDDRVKVTRVPLRRRETEASWLQGQRGDLREFRTVVKNLHDRPMKITVLDQTPFAENSAITVEMLNTTTPPTERNVKDRRGVMAWTYDYKPGEEREIRVGFRMRWPNDREIVLEPQAIPR